VRLILSYY
ncbi:hypothetical protein D027_2881B, partial [Vibrio parahaemolyticus 861]